MRILMIIGQFAPVVGGAERQCALLARALTARGHTVSVLTTRPERAVPNRETRDGVQIERVVYPIVTIIGHRMGWGFLAPLLLGWRALRMLASHDVVVAHQALWPAFVACVAARRHGKSIVVKLGNSGERFDLDVLRRTHWYGSFARRYLLRHVTRFIATSCAVCDDLRSTGVPADRVVEIPNGVVIPETPPRRHDSEALHVVFVGTLTPKKNVAVLLDAIARLAPADRARVKLSIVGDGPERAALERRALTVGIIDRVQFHGMVTDASSMLAPADVFVLPSRTEGLSNAALEAMAHGCALLMSNAGGNPDLIPESVSEKGKPFTRGETGILVDPRSPDAIAVALRWFLTHPNERQQMGAAARRLVEERYAIDYTAEQYERLLTVVAAPPIPRVVHLLTFLDSQTGGMERQALQLARALRVHGVSAFFITSVHVRRLWGEHLPVRGIIDGFRVYRIPFVRGWRHVNAVAYVLGAAALLFVFRGRYDIIHAHQLHTSGIAAAFVRLLISRKRCIVKDAAGGEYGDVSHLRRHPWITVLLRRIVDSYVGVSAATAAEMQHLGWSRIVQIPNGVDTIRFAPQSNLVRAAVRARLAPWAGDHPLVLAVGRLGPEKDYSTILAALAVCPVSATLAVVGTGPLLDTLVREAWRLGIGDRVQFVGVVHAVEGWYTAADVFVLASRSEGMPNTLLEAMSAGTPVIGSDAVGTRDVLIDTSVGLRFPIGNVMALAAALADTFRDRAAASARAMHARVLMESSYSLDAVAVRYATLYAKLVTTP